MKNLPNLHVRATFWGCFQRPVICGFSWDFHATNRCFNVPELGCPSKLVSIRNNRNWNRNLFRHYPKHNVCFGCFASIPKQRLSMFRLNRNKQKTNRNKLIGSIFCNFYRKFMVFSVFFSVFSVFFSVFSIFSRFFRFVSKQFVSVFRLFRFSTETGFRLIRNKHKTHPNSLKESIFGYFSENLGLLRFVSVCYETTLFVSVVSI